MKIDFPSLRKKDFGGIILRTLSYCLSLCGILLLVQNDISYQIISDGLKILSVLVSFALLLSFHYNARSRFRPGWTLPMSIILLMAGALYLVSENLLKTKIPTFGMTTVILILSGFNIALLISSAVQLRALALRRWLAFLCVSVINIAYVVLLYFNVWNMRQMPLVAMGIFLIVFAFQCFLEGIYGLWKK